MRGWPLGARYVRGQVGERMPRLIPDLVRFQMVNGVQMHAVRDFELSAENGCVSWEISQRRMVLFAGSINRVVGVEVSMPCVCVGVGTVLGG